MKEAFFRQPAPKQALVLEAAIEEFGLHGYEHGTLDRIIASCGISKGGLYEYTASKSDLYLYAIACCYEKLYEYLHLSIENQALSLPGDILKRFMLVSQTAIDFYLAHPHYIRLIAKSTTIQDEELARQVHAVFQKHFDNLFDNFHTASLAYDSRKILELLQWLLLKTRNDFLDGYQRGVQAGLLRTQYMDDWTFYLNILAHGIFAPQTGTLSI